MSQVLSDSFKLKKPETGNELSSWEIVSKPNINEKLICVSFVDCRRLLTDEEKKKFFKDSFYLEIASQIGSCSNQKKTSLVSKMLSDVHFEYVISQKQRQEDKIYFTFLLCEKMHAVKPLGYCVLDLSNIYFYYYECSVDLKLQIHKNFGVRKDNYVVIKIVNRGWFDHIEGIVDQHCRVISKEEIKKTQAIEIQKKERKINSLKESESTNFQKFSFFDKFFFNLQKNELSGNKYMLETPEQFYRKMTALITSQRRNRAVGKVIELLLKVKNHQNIEMVKELTVKDNNLLFFELSNEEEEGESQKDKKNVTKSSIIMIEPRKENPQPQSFEKRISYHMNPNTSKDTILYEYLNVIPTSVSNQLRYSYTPLFLCIVHKNVEILEKVFLSPRFVGFFDFKLRCSKTGFNALHQVIFELHLLTMRIVKFKNDKKDLNSKGKLLSIVREKEILCKIFKLLSMNSKRYNLSLRIEDVNINANLDYHDYKDISSIQFAMYLQIEESFIMRYFIESEKKANLYHVTRDYSNVLHFAIKGNYNNIVEYILQQHLFVNASPVVDIHGDVKQVVVEIEVAKNSKGEQPLFLSIQKFNLMVFDKLVLSNRVNINAKNTAENNNTPLISCIFLLGRKGNMKEKGVSELFSMIKSLVNSPYCDVLCQNKKELTAIDYVSCFPSNEIRKNVLKLLKNSRSPKLQNRTVDVREYKIKKLNFEKYSPGTSIIYKIKIEREELIYKRYRVADKIGVTSKMALKELKILEELKNVPFIVKGRYYCPIVNYEGIVLEYCDGGNLLDLYLLSFEGKLGIRYKLRILEQIAKGILKMHEKNIIHADLKPSNILLTKCGKNNSKLEVRICDFGCSKRINPENNLKEALEISKIEKWKSQHYTPPEKLHHNILYSKSDSYAFGWILYELLFNKKEDAFEDMIDKSLYSNKGYCMLVDKMVRKEKDVSTLFLGKKTFEKVNKEYHNLLKIIRLCLEKNFSKRPRFVDILKSLEECKLYYETTPFFSDVNLSHKSHGGGRNICCFRCEKIFCDKCLFRMCRLECCECNFCETCWKDNLKINNNMNMIKVCMDCIKSITYCSSKFK